MSDVILKGLTTIQDAVDKMSPEEVHLRFELSQHKKENEQLKQQLESLKHDYREKLGYLSSNKWTDKTALSVEMERLEKEELRGRLEYEVKMIEGAVNDEINRLKQQLESLEKENRGLKMMLNHVAGVEHVCEDLEVKLAEAVEVIEFYGNRFSWNFSRHPDHEYYAGAIKDDDSLLRYKEKNGDEFEDYCGGKRARQFLAKYRGEK